MKQESKAKRKMLSKRTQKTYLEAMCEAKRKQNEAK
jgi:hypothetical protein